MDSRNYKLTAIRQRAIWALGSIVLLCATSALASAAAPGISNTDTGAQVYAVPIPGITDRFFRGYKDSTGAVDIYYVENGVQTKVIAKTLNPFSCDPYVSSDGKTVFVVTELLPAATVTGIPAAGIRLLVMAIPKGAVQNRTWMIQTGSTNIWQNDQVSSAGTFVVYTEDRSAVAPQVTDANLYAARLCYKLTSSGGGWTKTTAVGCDAADDDGASCTNPGKVVDSGVLVNHVCTGGTDLCPTGYTYSPAEDDSLLNGHCTKN